MTHDAADGRPALAVPLGWQPIETAPKDADVVLLFADGWGVQPGYWYDTDGPGAWITVETQGLTGGRLGDDGPTHWMPLPDPPAVPLASRRREQEENEDKEAARGDGT